MTAEQAVRAALGAALRGHAGLRGTLNAVLDGPGGRATAPWAAIGDLLSADWGTKTAAGREIRASVTIRDLAEGPARLEALMGQADAAIAAMPRDLPGWRVASLVLMRSRSGRDGAAGWIGVADYRIRVLAG